MKRVRSFAQFAVILMWSVAAEAQWALNGAPVCTAAYYQEIPQIVPDGSGGSVIAWVDNRGATYDIYVQRLDANGDALWAANGVPICTAGGAQTGVQLVAAGSGGAIITWYDYRSVNYSDIYVQKIDGAGVVQWTANGVALCTDGNNQQYPQLVADGSGGAIVAWADGRGAGYDIYAQRIDANGAVMWTTDGIAICTAASTQFNQTLVADGAGGSIITWQDLRASDYDVYAQRVSSAGSVQWAVGGVAVCVATSHQQSPQSIDDGAGGAIITWADARSGTNDVYAQRINGSGVAQWTANGIAVSSMSADQMEPRLVTDGGGGAIIAWSDRRSGVNDIYAQRMSGSGAALWIANGVVVSAATGIQEHPRIVAVDVGRAVIAWNDDRNGGYDIYAQKLGTDGAGLWSADGASVSVTNGTKVNPAIASDGIGGAVVTWQDRRTATDDVYAQRMERNGYWGYPAPVIADVRDVPGDQGGFVDLAWYASRLDPYPEELIDEYTVWRGISHGAAELMAHDEALLLDDIAKIDRASEKPIIRVESTAAGAEYFWMLIATVNAYHLGSYAEVVPTLFDSTAVCDEYHYFQVIAHINSTGRYWISTPDSGRSVDNLAPAPPAGLAGEQKYQPAGLQLSWSRNGEADLDHYAVYRGTNVDFVPGLSNFVASPMDTICFVGDSGWNAGYYYKVSALDIHGNESSFALLAPSDVAGVDMPTTPDKYCLAQNVPNPFNPMTTITFDLATTGRVGLTIFDLSGRLVCVLLDDERPAGRHQARWDGTSGDGRQMASGTYFCRMEAGSFRETRRMTLVR